MMQCIMFLANQLSARIDALPTGIRAAMTVSQDINNIQSIQEGFVTQLPRASDLGSWISSSASSDPIGRQRRRSCEDQQDHCDERLRQRATLKLASRDAHRAKSLPSARRVKLRN